MSDATPPPAAANILRNILAILGALAGVVSVIGMLVSAVSTVGTIDAGVHDLSRRMGLAETQLGALTGQVSGLREAVIHLQDLQPTRHATAAPSDAYAGRTPKYRGGGIN